MLFHHLSTSLLLFYLFCGALCNTEIAVFSADELLAADRTFTFSWPTLGPSKRSIRLNATSALLDTALSQDVCQSVDRWTPSGRGHCPFEYWVVLDVDHVAWSGFNKFTLRASWPASFPADVSVTIFDARELPPDKQSTVMTKKTRKKYARLQFVHSGVFTPSSAPLDASLHHTVPVIVTLEPLQLGFLPQTVVPVVAAILLAAVAGFVLSRHVNSLLRAVAQPLKEEHVSKSK